MDADTCFYRFPLIFADWLQGNTARQLFLHDLQDEAATVPTEVRTIFEMLIDQVRPNHREWKMPYLFFNSGLLAFCPRDLDFDIAEKFLAWRANINPKWKQGRPGIWFGDWTQEQTAFLLMFGLIDPQSQPLRSDYRIGFHPQAVFCHFLRHGLIQPTTLASLTKVVRTLQ